MSCLGVHFALTDEQITLMKEQKSDSDRLEYLKEEIEEKIWKTSPELKGESDKAWDAMHRSLTDGHLAFDNGTFPLSHVVLGGERLYDQDDYLISLKSASQVQDIHKAAQAVTKTNFRERYFALDEDEYGFPKSEEDLEYTWEYFESVRELFKTAAKENLNVLFTADQ